MRSIPKYDLLRIFKIFIRRIGLLFLFVIALYFDGTHFASLFPHAQLMTNIFMVIAFAILYIRSNKRTRELMVYAVIIGFGGEYLFSVGLNMYTYRLENVPWYIAFGHAAVYARVYMFSKAPIIQKYSREITQFLYLLISIVAFVYWIVFNDVFGLVMTLGVFLMLMKRPRDRLFFLTMYMVVAVLEIGGTAYSTWVWPDIAFGVFPLLPSNNPPSGISLFYFLLDIGCFVMYILINRKSWNRFKNIQKYQLKSRHNDKES
ncbi:MAG: hypothetical protein HRT70_05085 [Flavobacteriaceae bacterium]|nr:hypothetical protein [Flavobacteriaceae bacterium]